MVAENRKDPEDPSSTSFAYDAMSPIWAKVNAVLGGTRTMRQAGERLLPRHENETATAYSRRLQGSFFFNASELTLDAWVGKPFSEPVVVDNLAEPIEDLLDDVDLQGNDVTVFARNWFREGLSKAFAHVLVDNPLLREEEGKPLTKADDTGRPYLCFVKPENLLSASAVFLDGQEVLTQVRILEEELIQVGFTATASYHSRRTTKRPSACGSASTSSCAPTATTGTRTGGSWRVRRPK
jgi:hypothetical protein